MSRITNKLSSLDFVLMTLQNDNLKKAIKHTYTNLQLGFVDEPLMTAKSEQMMRTFAILRSFTLYALLMLHLCHQSLILSLYCGTQRVKTHNSNFSKLRYGWTVKFVSSERRGAPTPPHTLAKVGGSIQAFGVIVCIYGTKWRMLGNFLLLTTCHEIALSFPVLETLFSASLIDTLKNWSLFEE